MLKHLILIVTLIIGFSTSAHAGIITAEMAERYYEDCTNKERPEKLSEKSQEALCACTASKMLERMSTEDVINLSNTDQAVARQAFNYMLVNVYAPCMEYPTRDHYYNTCYSNPKTRIISKEPRVLCHCMSSKIGSYMAKNGEDVFRDILKRNPNISDPLAALEGDPVFQDYTKKQVTSCLF